MYYSLSSNKRRRRYRQKLEHIDGTPKKLLWRPRLVSIRSIFLCPTLLK